MRVRPPVRIGVIASGIIGLATAGTLIALLRTIRSQPLGAGLVLTSALLVLALSLAALWLYGLIELLSLRYVVDRNGITIRTAFARQTIPHAAIERLEAGRCGAPPGHVQGLSWPGYTRGTVTLPGVGPVTIWGTEPLDRQLCIVTPDMTYAISPSDQESFLQHYAMRRELGALVAMPLALTPIGIAAWGVWKDRVFWIAAAVGLALSAALAALSIVRYSTLPTIIPLHWNAQGQPDRFSPRAGIFAIPEIGAIILLLNLVLAIVLHQRQRPASRLLAWGAVCVQIALWAAAWQALQP